MTCPICGGNSFGRYPGPGLTLCTTCQHVFHVAALPGEAPPPRVSVQPQSRQKRQSEQASTARS